MIQAYRNKWLPLNALALGMALSFGANTGEQKSVAVTAIVEHPTLDATRDGVKEALQEASYEDDKNLKWQCQSTQGNTGTTAQITRKFIGDKPDMIVDVVTPSAQTLVTAIRSTPIVFNTITDPIDAHLTPSWEAPDTNITGVSDMLALDKQTELIKRVVPDAERIDMVYNPGEANSVVVIEGLRELLPKVGLSLVEASAPRSVDVSSAARSLVGKVDAIYTNTGNNMMSAYKALVKVSSDARIPLIASDTDSVKHGAIAALGINYKEMGKQTGRMAVRILKGEKPGEIKPEASDSLQLFADPGATQKQDVTLSDELLKPTAEVIK